MKVKRFFTIAGKDALADIKFVKRISEIRNPDGSEAFRDADVEVPEFWSQVATDIIAQKYFRKSGIATRLKKAHEDEIPEWLQRSEPDVEALKKLSHKQKNRGEHSAKDVFHRLA